MLNYNHIEIMEFPLYSEDGALFFPLVIFTGSIERRGIRRENPIMFTIYNKEYGEILPNLQCGANFCCTAKWLSHTHTHTHIYTHFFSYIIFHHVLSQVIGYSSLCCTVGPHCLLTLNKIVCIYQPQTPSTSHTLSPPPWQPQVCSLCLSVSFCR